MDFYFGIDLLQQLRQYYESRLSQALAKGFDQQGAKYYWLFKELEYRVSTLRKLMSMISVLPEFMCRQTEDQIFAMVIGHKMCIRDRDHQSACNCHCDPGLL